MDDLLFNFIVHTRITMIWKDGDNQLRQAFTVCFVYTTCLCKLLKNYQCLFKLMSAHIPYLRNISTKSILKLDKWIHQLHCHA